MTLIWATRGRDWGFRFIRNDLAVDPLAFYDSAFAGIEDASEVRRHITETRAQPAMVALRFDDPDGRKDRAGRVIPHDFVVFDALADEVDSVEAGLRRIWPLVSDDFERIWQLPEPPSSAR